MSSAASTTPEPQLDPRTRALGLGLALLLPALLLVGAAAIVHLARHHEVQIGKELSTIAHLKVGQIERWLTERRQDAELISSSPTLTRDLDLWLVNRDPGLADQILERLEAMRRIEGFQALMVLDAAGEILLGVGEHHRAAAPLGEALRRAQASGRVEFTDLYRDRVDGAQHLHLDLVSPLKDAAGGPARALVLRLDQDAFLFPFVRVWPRPSPTAETLLVRRDGDSVLFLNELRHRAAGTLDLRLPLRETRVLAALVVSGRAPADEPIRALDYRGEPVLGVAVPVAGTDWFLIAKTDQAEVAAGAWRDLLWMGVGLLLTLALTLVTGLFLRSRESLRFARVRQQEQAERLQTLQLLDAIVAASNDVIFAKDPQGRYLLLNQAAARACGKPLEAAIGRDDRALFPPAQAALLMENDQRVMTQDGPINVEETLETPDGPVTFLGTKGPLHDAAGRVIGLYGIARDISERARTEEAIRRQLAELQRWQRLTLGREGRILDLKREVNDLLAHAGQEPRYREAGEEVGIAPGVDANAGAAGHA